MAGTERDPVGGSTDPVDFIVGDQEPAVDEELPEPSGSRSRVLPRVLALGAAALVAGVLVMRIHTGGGHPAAASSPAPSPAAPSTSVVERPVPPVPGTGQLLAEVPQHGPRWCPGGVSVLCTSTSRVPAPARAAVRNRFPASHLVSAFEEVRDIGFGPDGLWYRELHVRQGRSTIDVVVHRRSASDLAGISEDIDPSGSTLTVTRLVRGFTVQIRVLGPANRPTSQSRARGLYAFAADAHLRVAG